MIVVVGGLGLVMSRSSGLAGRGAAGRADRPAKPERKKADLASGILARPAAIDLGRPSFWTRLIPNAENLNLLYEQADVNMSFKRFMRSWSAASPSAGSAVGVAFRLPIYAIPLGLGLPGRRCRSSGCCGASSSGSSQFVAAMPDAVELISRALRAGHGLASGLHLVAEEMKGPIADEFNRVFEEQNLGIPIELALRNMADRIPSMDVRFFVIAVIIQRSTGGDLAEVLDKIGRLIRQRFELFGHVKALTAEGRLSGVVLLAMPPALLGVPVRS